MNCNYNYYRPYGRVMEITIIIIASRDDDDDGG